MIYYFWENSGELLAAVLVAVTFAAAFIGFKCFAKYLPKDHGREFAVNGALSQGKPRGAGIILVSVFTLCCALFVKIDLEQVINLALIYAAMLTGFLDDAAKVPWGELKKGLLDLVIAGGMAGNFVWHNSSEIVIFGEVYNLPAALYVILAIGLIWMSINVVNCTDGVDGLCASLSLTSVLMFMQIPAMLAKVFDLDAVSASFDNVRMPSLVMVSVLAAYLWFNCSPSLMLMGDAGSRALGVFIALMAMQSRHPLMFIPLVIVMILDGGLGLVKLTVRRVLHSKTFMDGIRTPLHDHARKNKGWSDTQVVIRFVLLQLVIGLFSLYLFVMS